MTNLATLIQFLQDCLTPLSMQALPDSPESLCIAEMGGTEGRDGEPGMPGQLYLNIGKSRCCQTWRNFVVLGKCYPKFI
jgi:hypothetical protein